MAGPVIVVMFQGRSTDDRFFMVFDSLRDDPESIQNIVKRIANDGYTPTEFRKGYQYADGTIEARDIDKGGLKGLLKQLDFRPRSAFLRA